MACGRVHPGGTPQAPEMAAIPGGAGSPQVSLLVLPIMEKCVTSSTAKRAVPFLVTAMVVAACGGGGGSSDTKALSGTTDVQFSSEVLTPASVSAVSASSIEGQPACVQVGGQLPPGMTFDNTCRLQGTPTTPGLYASQFTVTAAGYAGSLQVNATYVVGGLRLRASAAPLSAAAPGGVFTESVVDIDVLQPFTFKQGDALTYVLSSGTLPDTVSLNPSNGTLSGTNLPGTFAPAVFAIGATLQRGGLTYALAPFPVTWPRTGP